MSSNSFGFMRDPFMEIDEMEASIDLRDKVVMGSAMGKVRGKEALAAKARMTKKGTKYKKEKNSKFSFMKSKIKNSCFTDRLTSKPQS